MAENEILTLNAERREESGKSAAKKMRAEGTIPGVFYYAGKEAIHLQFNLHEVEMLLRQRPTLMNLVWGKGEDDHVECMIREVQRHPVTHIPTHLDLIGFTRGVKINATVQVELIGTPAGVKDQGGILQQAMGTVDIICFPRNLPKSIEIDVSDMQLGDTLHLKDVVREGIEWDDNVERTVCTVVMPRLVVEEEEGEGEEGEEGVEGAEGEEGAAGEGGDESEGGEE